MIASVAVATCRLGDLIGTPQSALLNVTPVAPDSLMDSATVGSTARHAVTFEVSNEGGGELSWKAQVQQASPWLSLSPDSGIAPSTVQVLSDPSGLDTGVYRDRITVQSTTGTGSQDVPVRFRVHPCRAIPILVDDTRDDSLTTADCGTAHRTNGQQAQLFSFPGTGGDTASVVLSASFDGYIALDSVLDSTLAPSHPPLAEADECDGDDSNPCLYYVILPRTQTYYVEITTDSSVDSGQFTLRLVHAGRNPLSPASLDQLRDATTPIGMGDTIAQTNVLLQAVVSDSDHVDQLRLEAEVKPVGTGFNGANLVLGQPVANGELATVNVTGLSDNTAYQWRVRTVDQTGRRGDWTEFGTVPGTVDFAVDIPQAPAPPGALAQFEGDSTTAIGTGAAARSDTVVLSGLLTDPDPGDELKLYVEVQPIGTSFTDTATDSSVIAVPTNTTSFVRITGLINNINYHWQAWTMDQTGRASSPVSYGGNSEGSTDFRIQVPNAPDVPQNLNQFQSDGSTAIPPGGDANTPTVIFRGTVSDPDVGQTVRLEVEVQPVGIAFTDTPTVVSTFVASGSQATASVTSPTIVAGGDYHWQARAVDNTSLASTWVSFPPDTGRDFHVATTVAELVFTQQPTVDTAGRPVRPDVTVEARDANHNLVSGFSGQITMSISTNPAGGTLTGTTSVNAVGGIATFSNLVIDKAGSGYRLRATAGTINSLESASFDVLAGPAVRLLFTGEPSTTEATLPITPAVVVTALDGQGNTATSFTTTVDVAILANPNGGTLGGTTSLSAMAGVATFSDLTIDKLGSSYTLRASAAGVASDTSVAFDITQLGTTHLEFTTPPTTTAAGAVISGPSGVVVTAKDQSGQTVTTFNQSVTMAIGTNPSGGAFVSSTTTVTASAGVATFSNLRIDKVGSGYTLTASSSGVPDAGSGAFDITPGPTTHLVFGTPPSNTVAGIPISPAVVVGGRDQFDNVTTLTGSFTMGFAANPNGGAFTASSQTTVSASSGVATFNNLRIDKTGPGYALVATQSSLTTGASNTFTVTSAPPVALVFANQPSNTDAGAAISNPTGVVVTARDSLANTATTFNSPLGMSIAAGPTSAFAPTSTNSATATNGVATFANLRIYQAGTGYRLQASGGSLTTPSSNPFTIRVAPAVRDTFVVQPGSTVVNAIIDSAVGGVKVTITDSVGNTVTSDNSHTITVALFSNPSGATLSGTKTRTVSAGTATFNDLRVTKVGTGYTLSAVANLGGNPSDFTVPFDVVAGPVSGTSSTISASPTSITASSGSSTSTITVTAEDQFGDPIQGATVVLAASGTGNTLTQPSSTTNASGVATGTLSSTGAETKTVSATIDGTSVSTTVVVTVTPATTDTLEFTRQITNTTAGATINGATGGVVVTAYDAFNNVATGFTGPVTMAIGTGSPGAKLSGTSPVAAITGVATFTDLSINKTGSYTLTASATGPSSGISNTFSITAGTPSQVAFVTEPSNTTAGATISPAVQVDIEDASGNRISTASNSITLAITSGTGTSGAHLSGGTGVATVNGVATFDALSIDSAGTAYTLRATSGSLTPDTSTTFDITVGAATHLSITTQPSSSAQAGVAFGQQPVIQLRDAGGNAVSQSGVTVTATIATNPGGTPSLVSNTATTNATGTATFGVLAIDGLVGNYTLSFGAGVLTPVTSGTIALSTGPATQLTITTQPSSGAQSGIAFSTQPVIQLRDAGGNPVSQNNVTITATIATKPAGSASLTNATAFTNASGAATFNGLAITGPTGDYTLSFDSGTLTSVTSNTITLSAGTATQLAITTQPSSSAQAGVAFAQQPVIQLQDGGGNPVSQSGVTVTATIATNPGGSPVLVNASASTNPSGAATFSGLAIDGLVGNYTLSFAAGVLTPVTSGTIALSTGPATQLTITTQPSSGAQSGIAFSTQPVIQLRDAGGNPVSQNNVTITATIATKPAGSASLTNATAFTNASGAATFNGLAITGPTGDYTLSFDSGTLTSVTSNTITLSAGTATQLAITTQPSSSAQAGVAFAQQPVIQLQDGGGNPVSQSGVTVTATIATDPGGTPSLVSNTATTNATGTATFSVLAIDGLVGDYTLSFGAGVLTPATSGTISLSVGPATTLAFGQEPTSTTGGATISPAVTVRILDAGDNLTSSTASVSLTIHAGTGTGGAHLAGGAAVGAVNGVATFGGLSIDSAGTGYQLDASSTGLAGATSSAFTVSVGLPAQLAFLQQPTNTKAGIAINPPVTVRILDAGGNFVNTATNAVTLTIGNDPSSGATLTGGGPAAANNGVATFSGLSIDMTGNGYTLIAGATGVAGTATSTSFNITP